MHLNYLRKIINHFKVNNMKKIAYIALALVLTACGGNKSQMPQGSNDFAVITVGTAEADLNTSYPATIKGQQDIEIRPKVAGHITRVLVDEGASVRKGQALFEIDKTQYAAAVKAAEAQINVVKAQISTQELTVANKKMLLDKAIISKYDYDMAANSLESLKAQLAAAQAQLINAKDQLSFCTVVSPADGVVGEIPYRVGSLVSASTAAPLTTVSNISKMYVYFSMTEKQLLGMSRETGGVKEAIAKMPAVRLILADGTEYGQTGTISAISGVIDQATGSVQIRADFDNSGHILRSGGTGSVLIPTHTANAILIPQKATYEVQDKKFVYIVGADNKVKNTEITVLTQNDGKNYVVTSGLKAGDRIVVEGINKLKNDMEIQPITPEQAKAKQAKAQQHMKEGKLPNED